MNSMASVYAKDNWDLGAAGGVEDAAAFDVQISGWKAKDGWDYGSLREKTSSLATLLPSFLVAAFSGLNIDADICLEKK
eukprot:scaffold112802_cov15-Tisochrysis_lutea.AAC.1